MSRVFRRKVDPRCVYCGRSSPMNPKEVTCVKRGVVDAYDHCRSFTYDPLKRVPPKPVKMGRDYKKEDFVI